MGLQNPLAATNAVQKERKSEKEKAKDGFVIFFFLFAFSSSRVFVACTLLCSYQFFTLPIV